MLSRLGPDLKSRLQRLANTAKHLRSHAPSPYQAAKHSITGMNITARSRQRAIHDFSVLSGPTPPHLPGLLSCLQLPQTTLLERKSATGRPLNGLQQAHIRANSMTHSRHAAMAQVHQQAQSKHTHMYTHTYIYTHIHTVLDLRDLRQTPLAAVAACCYYGGGTTSCSIGRFVSCIIHQRPHVSSRRWARVIDRQCGAGACDTCAVGGDGERCRSTAGGRCRYIQGDATAVSFVKQPLLCWAPAATAAAACTLLRAAAKAKAVGKPAVLGHSCCLACASLAFGA